MTSSRSPKFVIEWSRIASFESFEYSQFRVSQKGESHFRRTSVFKTMIPQSWLTGNDDSIVVSSATSVGARRDLEGHCLQNRWPVQKKGSPSGNLKLQICDFHNFLWKMRTAKSYCQVLIFHLGHHNILDEFRVYNNDHHDHKALSTPSSGFCVTVLLTASYGKG